MLPDDLESLFLGDIHSITALIEVFVDDFIGCIDDIMKTKILQTTRAMLHGIHRISPPPHRHHRTQWGDPILEKKLDKLKGLWLCVKEILGWFIDGTNYTLYLPDKKWTKSKSNLDGY